MKRQFEEQDSQKWRWRHLEISWACWQTLDARQQMAAPERQVFIIAFWLGIWNKTESIAHIDKNTNFQAFITLDIFML